MAPSLWCVGWRTDGVVMSGFNPNMDHSIPLYPLPYATLPVDLAIAPNQPTPWWNGLSNTGRYPVLLGVVGMVLVVGMLLAFLQVVSGAVQQGEARRAATAAHLAAVAGCTAMRGPSAQDACRVQVAAANSPPQ